MLDTIPALIKPLPDSQVMVESLIENVHRANLKPMEQAKAILEVFKADNLNRSERFIDDNLPQKIANIRNKHSGKYTNNDLTEEEVILDNIVKKIGLSHDPVYASLKLLSLSDSIQSVATEKGIGKRQLAYISAIETEEDQKEVFDVVVEKELSKQDTAALTKVVKSAPEPVKRAVLDATVPVEVAQTIINTKRSDEEQEAKAVLEVFKAEENLIPGIRIVDDQLPQKIETIHSKHRGLELPNYLRAQGFGFTRIRASIPCSSISSPDVQNSLIAAFLLSRDERARKKFIIAL